MEAQDILVCCSDEKMDIQALEHAHEAAPVKAGQVERIEHEYIRRGTSGLTASRRVVDGKIIFGILKSMETRSTFLSDPTHRIQFIYTPKHTSWLKLLGRNE